MTGRHKPDAPMKTYFCIARLSFFVELSSHGGRYTYEKGPDLQILLFIYAATSVSLL